MIYHMFMTICIKSAIQLSPCLPTELCGYSVFMVPRNQLEATFSLKRIKILTKEFWMSLNQILSRSSHRKCSVKKGVLRNFANILIIKKEALAQVFSSELCEISKNTFFTEDLSTPHRLLRPTRDKIL